MEQNINEAVQQVSTGGKRVKKSNKKPGIILGAIAAVLAAGYVGVCAYANSLATFYPNSQINGMDVSGLTVEEAQTKIETELPNQVVSFYEDGVFSSDNDRVPLLTMSLSELGFTPELVNASAAVPFESWAQDSMSDQSGNGFFSKGITYLKQQFGGSSGGSTYGYTLENSPSFDSVYTSILDQLSTAPVDSSFSLTDTSVDIVKARDGYAPDKQALKQCLNNAGNYPAYFVEIPFATVPATVLTAQDIYDQVAGEMKNAGYDSTTDTITPEQVGAEFDVKSAQAALDAAAPGETVEIPAVIQFPTVTAEDLKAVLFRDVLGEYTTNVSGTTARRNNVKLSASTINNYVMNTGDVFSYNGVVGQRTAANGYQPAPAYVKGETVDEIGGGICQTSSTLYLACLRGNLEITERYAHRYIPSYVPAGMDATVSWGGPDYKFTNNTDYPIKIVTSYVNSKLTVKILGTNVDGSYGRMTNEHLSTTEWETVYEEDETIAPGTQSVKTTAYTGSKWRTYHHIYDASGKLIDSHYEATSDYKARNKVILVAPGELPGAEPTVPVVTPIPVPVDPSPVEPTPDIQVEPQPVEPNPDGPVVDETPESPSVPEEEDIPIIVVPDLTETPAE